MPGELPHLIRRSYSPEELVEKLRIEVSMRHLYGHLGHCTRQVSICMNRHETKHHLL